MPMPLSSSFSSSFFIFYGHFASIINGLCRIVNTTGLLFQIFSQQRVRLDGGSFVATFVAAEHFLDPIFFLGYKHGTP